MKKILLAFVFSASLVSGAFAQNKQPTASEFSGPENMEKYLGGLNLSESQKKEIAQVNSDYKQVIGMLTAENGYSPDAIREKTASMELERETRIMKILSPEQQKSFEAAIAGATIDPTTVAKRLGLSAAQSARFVELNNSISEKIIAIRQNPDMSPEEKNKTIFSLEAERQANIEQILTPDQLKMLAGLKSTNITPASKAVSTPKSSSVPVKKQTNAAKPVKKG